MRNIGFLISALLVILFFIESCAPTLTSHALQPARPHVVLQKKDTVYARSVVVKNRFLAPVVVVDDTTFSRNELQYAQTDWGHRYFVINNEMIEQIVSGKIDVFSNGLKQKQNKAWKIDDSGKYTVKTFRPAYIRKLPSQQFLKPDNPTLFALVGDYKPAQYHMRKAMLYRSHGVVSAWTSSALVGAGLVLFFLSTLDHTNPNSELLQTMGLTSIVTGCLVISVAFPTFMIGYKRHRVMAIETYNRGDF